MLVIPLAENEEDEDKHNFPAPQLTARLVGKTSC